MEKIKDLNEIKHKLIDWVKTETTNGFSNPEEVAILGEVVDMIKDLASAEESCMEAAYYENVTEAMENYEEGDGERMGYDRWRYSSGRFAPKGRGHRSGYMPPVYETMGYPAEGRTVTRDGRAGYTPNVRMGHDMKPAEKLDTAMDTMGDIWAESDTETKKKMANLVRGLLEEMEHSGF